jgi:alkyl hydroperoxide reductase subunit AhpF
MPPFLDVKLKKQLKEVFSELIHPVEIVLFTSQVSGCEYCADTRQLLEELVPLSSKLSISVYDLEADAALAKELGVDKAPMFILAGQENGRRVDYGVRLSGIPAGHEFTSLIQSMIIVSKRDSGLNANTRKFLAGLTQPVSLLVFTTPT